MKKSITTALSTGIGVSGVLTFLHSYLHFPENLKTLIFLYATIASCVLTAIAVHKRMEGSREAAGTPKGFQPFLAKVVLRDGSKIKGIVLNISHGFLFLKPLEDEEEKIFSFSSIKKMEIV